MYPDKPTPRTSPKDRNQRQRAEELTGTRAGVPEKKAVTREDAAALGQVELLSAMVTAAPTVAQHNALVADIRQIANALNRMGAKFTGL